MNETIKEFFSTVRKTLWPMGWLFAVLSAAGVVLSIVFAIRTKDTIFIVTGMIGAAQLALSAGLITIGKAAKRIEEAPTKKGPDEEA